MTKKIKISEIFEVKTDKDLGILVETDEQYEKLSKYLTSIGYEWANGTKFEDFNPRDHLSFFHRMINLTHEDIKHVIITNVGLYAYLKSHNKFKDDDGKDLEVYKFDEVDFEDEGDKIFEEVAKEFNEVCE